MATAISSGWTPLRSPYRMASIRVELPLPQKYGWSVDVGCRRPTLNAPATGAPHTTSDKLPSSRLLAPRHPRTFKFLRRPSLLAGHRTAKIAIFVVRSRRNSHLRCTCLRTVVRWLIICHSQQTDKKGRRRKRKKTREEERKCYAWVLVCFVERHCYAATTEH